MRIEHILKKTVKIFIVLSLAFSYGFTATFVLKIGKADNTSGSGNGEFSTPYGIGIDSSGNIYVADSDNNRVQKFDSSGIYVSQFGSSGTGDGQFSSPRAVEIDSSGNIYVADYFNNRVQKFDSSGIYVSQFGSSGTGNGQFNGPYGIGIDSGGNIYVADGDNNRVQKFGSSGNYVSQFGSSGSGNGQFSLPIDVVADSSGNIYVADALNNRVQKFNSSGIYVSQFGSSGSADGQFDGPYGITIDSGDNIYVVDYSNSRVQKFDSSGIYVSQFGSSGTGDGQFQYLRRMVIDSGNNIYVVDTNNHRIQKFTQNQAPTATSLFLTNTPTSTNKTDTLTLNYTYADNESDAETTSTYKWYTADDASGTNKIAISDATSTTYVVTSSEEKKYIAFSVTPVNAISSGTETFLSSFILVNDTTAPTLNSSTPTDGAIDIVVSNNLTLTFNENIALGSSGTIKIVDDTDNSTTLSIDVTNHNTQLSVATTTLTIDPTNDLSANKSYHIEISNGAIVDTASTPNSFAGISDTTTLNFKTPDNIVPTLSSSTPSDGLTSFNSTSNIVLTFSEDIALGTGNIVIYDTNGAVATIAVTNHSNQLSISNAVLTINPTSDLSFETDYYIQIDATAITDISTNANAYAGISDTTTLNFKTLPPSADLSYIVASKWNMVAISDEREVTATNISGATIWTFNNTTNAWENPTTLTAGKGYIVYTTNTTGYDSISASVVNSTVTDDYTTIKNIGDNSWTLVGISKSISGISWSNIYNPTNTLKTNCNYTHIFYFDTTNSTWNTTTNIPYLGSVWAKQYCSQLIV